VRDGQYTREVPAEEQELVERLVREGKIVAHPYGWEPPPFTLESLKPTESEKA